MPFMSSAQPTQRPAPLTGPLKTRAEARARYPEIVAELRGIGDRDTLEIYLMTIGEEVLQFEVELDFFWNGDGEDFPGLAEEIRRAWNSITAEW